MGFPLAKYLLDLGYPLVKGSTTSPEKLDSLQKAGIDAHLVSLNPEPQGDDWEKVLNVDTLIVDIPPRTSKQGEDFHPQQMRYLMEMIKKTTVTEILYISSTSVYREVDKEVDEQDVLEASDSAAPFLVEAEQMMLALRGRDRKVTVLRCGGLMGYDRIPGKYVKGKKDMTTGDIPVNYVHRDDVIALIAALLAKGFPDETFNAVAPQHPLRRMVYETSCEEFGWKSPTFKTAFETEPFKVVSSRKIITHLGYTFLYPDPLTFYYQLD